MMYLLAAVFAYSKQLNVDRWPVVSPHFVRANAANRRPHIGWICIERHRFETGRIVWTDGTGDDVEQRRVGLGYAELWLRADHGRSHVQRA